MGELIADTIEDSHAIAAHFPIALLVVSAFLTVVGRFSIKADLQLTTWVLLLLGTIGSVVASVTGIISHFPYEETDLHGVIETHQNWSFVVTGFFIALTVWRWISMRKGGDAGESYIYLALVLAGIVGLTLSGITGGDLVYDYGINVRGVNPLLEQ